MAYSSQGSHTGPLDWQINNNNNNNIIIIIIIIIIITDSSSALYHLQSWYGMLKSQL